MEAVKRYGILTVGSVVLGISDYMFKFQNHFSFGGVSGIAVIMSGSAWRLCEHVYICH